MALSICSTLFGGPFAAKRMFALCCIQFLIHYIHTLHCYTSVSHYTLYHNLSLGSFTMQQMCLLHQFHWLHQIYSPLRRNYRAWQGYAVVGGALATNCASVYGDCRWRHANELVIWMIQNTGSGGEAETIEIFFTRCFLIGLRKKSVNQSNRAIVSTAMKLHFEFAALHRGKIFCNIWGPWKPVVQMNSIHLHNYNLPDNFARRLHQRKAVHTRYFPTLNLRPKYNGQITRLAIQHTILAELTMAQRQ